MDGVAWSPSFKNLAMEPGSILDLDGGKQTVETATGAGTVANGSLTVTQALVVDPGVFLPSGGITEEGDLTFGAGAKITFPNADDYRRTPFGQYTLATATGTISGFTGASMLDLGDQHRDWTVRLSADGKTISIERIPRGTILYAQ